MNAQEAYEMSKPGVSQRHQQEQAEAKAELNEVLTKIREAALLGVTRIEVKPLVYANTVELCKLGYLVTSSLASNYVSWDRPVRLPKKFINKLLDKLGY